MTSKNFLLLALRLAAMGAFAVVSTLTLPAQGTRDQLNGTYSFTGEQACLVSPNGFNPNLTPAGAASVQSASVQGTMTFNADGRGSGEFVELLISHPPAAQVFASSQEASFSFTYTVADDGVLTIVSGPVTGKFTSGPFIGLSFSNDPPPMAGRVARNGSAISITILTPAVETSVLGPPLSVSIPRICHRARTLLPIHVEREP